LSDIVAENALTLLECRMECRAYLKSPPGRKASATKLAEQADHLLADLASFILQPLMIVFRSSGAGLFILVWKEQRKPKLSDQHYDDRPL